MKRSEAVHLVRLWLAEFYEMEDNTVLTDAIVDAWCATLLNRLEQVGMLPPRVKIEGTQFSDNCWEKE